MCGFVTIYSSAPSPFAPDALRDMTQALAHRGPDGFGYALVGPEQRLAWRDGEVASKWFSNIAMGHRRLSILDLSEAGHQPFASPDQRFWMVYNGEVFNYLEIRRDLKARGYAFHTGTDTEVVLNAYREWGSDCLERFNGMFAFLIWDNSTRTLFAARDRIGIKPLFYARLRKQWLFASEIKALGRHPDFSLQPDEERLFHFLWNDDAPSDCDTFYRNVRALPPAHFLRITPGGHELRRYWHLPAEPVASGASHEDRAAELLELLRDSVRLQLRADVPVGTMLSGGLDSTTIASLSNELLRADVSDAASLGDQQRAISSCYPGAWNDESDKIDQLAAQLDIRVEKIFPHQTNVANIFGEVVRAVEEPFGGTMPLVQYMMMQRAREIGVKVTLNGHGPDEMFAGYPGRHCSFVAAEYARRGDWRRLRAEMEGMRRFHHVGMADFLYALVRVQVPAAAQGARNLATLRKRRYFRGDLFRRYPSRASRFRDDQMEGSTPLDRRLKREFFSEIVPRYLTYEDRVSMASSIESRVPFLDHRVVEFAFGLPDSDKVSGGISKYILRNATRSILPPAISNANLKVYVDPGFVEWLRGDLRQLAMDSLGEGESHLSEFLQPDHTRPLIRRLLEGQRVSGWERQFVWRAFVAEQWMRMLKEGAGASSLEMTTTPRA